MFITTNKDDSPNNKIYRVSVATPNDWTEVIVPHDPKTKIDDVLVCKHFIGFSGRQDGLTQLWLARLDATTAQLTSPMQRLT